MGKKTRAVRDVIRANMRNMNLHHEPPFPARRRIVSDETAALDAEFERRSAAKSKAEAAAMVSRLSAKYPPRRLA